MPALRYLTLFAAVLVAPLLRATSVIPPKFSELVAESDAIYRAHVTAVQARHVAAPNGNVVIKTYVTLGIEHTLKGAVQDTVTLEFLGGTIGDETLSVSGMPQFTVGEHGIYFVQGNGRQFAPLVRFTHGRYRIEHSDSTGHDYVSREDHSPLNSADEVELPLSDAAHGGSSHSDAAHALSPAAFEANITAEIQHATPVARPN
jgi:hypothetical protein